MTVKKKQFKKKSGENESDLVLCVKIHFPRALHGAEEVAELVVDLFHQLLQWVQPTLLSLEGNHNYETKRHDNSGRSTTQ